MNIQTENDRSTSPQGDMKVCVRGGLRYLHAVELVRSQLEANASQQSEKCALVRRLGVTARRDGITSAQLTGASR